MASRKSQRIRISNQEAMGQKLAGKKRKGQSERDALEVTDSEEEETPLAVILSSLKSKKGESSNKEAAETPEEGQKDVTPTPKRKKQRANRNLEDEEEGEKEIQEPIPASPQAPVTEKGESSKKKKKSKSGKDFISHTWFNDFQTYGKWLDGYASNSVGYCSLISPILIDKLKSTSCINKLQTSSAWSIINRSERAYPRLTKLFYVNLRQKKDSEWCLISKVGGIDIELNHRVFSEVLGFEFKKEESQDLDRKELLKKAKVEFFSEESTSKHQLTHSILTAEAKILFTIFMRCIIPKEHSKELLSDKVLYSMYLIMHDYQIDLPAIIMEHMLYAASMQKKYALPYSNLLSLFFRHFGIPLEKEETIKEGFGMISEKTLQNLGIVQTKQGAWKLISKLSKEELKQKNLKTLKQASSPTDQPQILQRLDLIDNEIEGLKEGVFGIGSELILMKHQLASMEQTMLNILEQVKFSAVQNAAMSKGEEEEASKADSDNSEAQTAEQKKGNQLSSDELFETGSESEQGDEKKEEEKGNSEEAEASDKGEKKAGDDEESD